jgi:hypothetical protein
MLYRTRMLAVTLAASMALATLPLAAQILPPQYGRKAAIDKGPRALGLVQLSPKGGKGRLIPIAIMMDGKFYDAGSYKASPVPMALDFETVYEGFRTGVSQGIFTITQPGQLNHVWMAEGTWLPAGMKAPEKSKKYATPVIEDKDAPPVLHRHSEKSDAGSTSADKDKDKDKDKKPDETKAEDKDKADKKGDQKAPSAPAAPDATKTPPAPAESAKSAEPPADEPISDPNRPRLRRGKPESTEHREAFTNFDELPTAGATPQITLIPAISDAGGPDPRPYTYEMNPAEEAGYRNKMIDLAVQLHTKAAGGKETAVAGKKSARKSAAKPAEPALDDVILHVFALSNSNEPILVLSAKTHVALPPIGAASGSVEEPKEITLIARTNLEGELRKLHFSQTDSRHLDVTPRMELVDAVDADGDGRGELLFRRTNGDGSAYAIYRVTADGLWPLFEGTP